MSHAPATVVSVSRDAQHRVSKPRVDRVKLVAGFGIEGDAHAGATVKHRFRVRKDPTQPNLRQVHLLQSEVFEEVAVKGFALSAGELGENITTHGVDLLRLPVGSLLRLGPDAVVQLTGLRDPCRLMNQVTPGLMKAFFDRTDDGTLVRKSGVMSVVVTGGIVQPGDSIRVELPGLPHTPLDLV